ncbi:hypothetical protein ACJX0J_008479, partial [Zea mays]
QFQNLYVFSRGTTVDASRIIQKRNHQSRQGGNLLIDLFRHCDNHLGEKQVNNPFFHKTPSGMPQLLLLSTILISLFPNCCGACTVFFKTNSELVIAVRTHLTASCCSAPTCPAWLPSCHFHSLRQTRTTCCFRLHPIRDEDAK